MAKNKDKRAGLPVFPANFRQGSEGPSVNLLALLMLAQGYGNPEKIKFDHQYTKGGQISKAVKAFQQDRNKHFGAKLRINGDFDRATQGEFGRVIGVNIGRLIRGMFAGDNYYAVTLKDFLDTRNVRNQPRRRRKKKSKPKRPISQGHKREVDFPPTGVRSPGRGAH